MMFEGVSIEAGLLLHAAPRMRSKGADAEQCTRWSCLQAEDSVSEECFVFKLLSEAFFSEVPTSPSSSLVEGNPQVAEETTRGFGSSARSSTEYPSEISS